MFTRRVQPVFMVNMEKFRYLGSIIAYKAKGGIDDDITHCISMG